MFKKTKEGSQGGKTTIFQTTVEYYFGQLLYKYLRLLAIFNDSQNQTIINDKIFPAM